MRRCLTRDQLSAMAAWHELVLDINTPYTTVHSESWIQRHVTRFLTHFDRAFKKGGEARHGVPFIVADPAAVVVSDTLTDTQIADMRAKKVTNGKMKDILTAVGITGISQFDKERLTITLLRHYKVPLLPTELLALSTHAIEDAKKVSAARNGGKKDSSQNNYGFQAR